MLWMWALALAGPVSLLIASRLSLHAIKYETPALDWLRCWSLRLRTLGGTDFRDALLNSAEFYNADLNHARLSLFQ